MLDHVAWRLADDRRTGRPHHIDQQLRFDLSPAQVLVAVTPAAGVVKVEKNVIYPVTDGTTTLKVEFGGKSLDVPVKIKDAKTDRPISFRLDGMPIFMASSQLTAPNRICFQTGSSAATGNTSPA